MSNSNLLARKVVPPIRFGICLSANPMIEIDKFAGEARCSLLPQEPLDAR